MNTVYDINCDYEIEQIDEEFENWEEGNETFDFTEVCESDYDSDDDRLRISGINPFKKSVRAPRPINTKSVYLINKNLKKQNEIKEQNERRKEIELENKIKEVEEKFKLQKELERKQKLEKQKQKEIEEIERKKELEKTKLCKSVMINGKFETSEKCSMYGENCNYAHNENELKIKICLYDNYCIYVKYSKSGNVTNVPNVKICHYIHRGESKAMLLKRIGLKTKNKNTREKAKQKENVMVRPKTVFNPWKITKKEQQVKNIITYKPVTSNPLDNIKIVESVKTIETTETVKIANNWITKENKTRKNKKPINTETKNALCRFIRNCRNGDKCRFSHSMKDLKECRFGNTCRNVKLQNGIYINIETSRICTFKHPGEKLENNYKRVCK